MARFVLCCFCITRSSCQAGTRLTATASTSPERPPLRESCRTSDRCDRMLDLVSFSSLGGAFFVFTHVLARQFQVVWRRLLGFLDKTVQQHHAALCVDVEQHPGDLVLAEVSEEA